MYNDIGICSPYDSLISRYSPSSSLVSSLSFYVSEHYEDILIFDPIFTVVLQYLTNFSYSIIFEDYLMYSNWARTTNITLAIDQLEDMPTDSDLQVALGLVFSWVSEPLPAVDMPIDNFTCTMIE